MYFSTDQPGMQWVYYYSTAHRTPQDDAAYSHDSAQDQASAVVKLREEDRDEAAELCRQLHGRTSPEDMEEMLDFVSTLRQNTEAMLIRHFPDEPMKVGEMRRIAVGQAQGEAYAMRVAERLARQACVRFGIQLV